MTFSQQVKGEILKSVRNIKGCCATSILTAVLKASGSLSLGFRGYCFAIESENPEFLSFVEQIAKNELGVSSHISSSNVNASTINIDENLDMDMAENAALTTEAIRSATIVLSCVPIMCVYPFLQKYFVQGLRVGSVKG